MIDLIESMKQFSSEMFSVLGDRSEEHGDSWKGRTGAIGLFCQIERKTDRLHENVYRGLIEKKRILSLKAAKDSCVDMANYAGFMWIILDEMERLNNRSLILKIWDRIKNIFNRTRK